MKNGRIIIQAGRKPWPHELRVANILALAGHDVEFICETSIKMPDIFVDNTAYEIKSPISDKVDAIERNIVRALEKCPNIILDSSRMRIGDAQVLHELVKRRKNGKGMKKVLFINKYGSIIDIEKLI